MWLADDLLWIWIAAIGSFAGMVVLLFSTRRTAVDRRVGELAGGAAGQQSTHLFSVAGMAADNSLERHTARRIQRQEKARDFRERMVQAGMYSAQAARAFLLLRLLLLVGPAGLGLSMANMGYISRLWGVLLGLMVGLVGTLAPSFYLDRLKRNRQIKIRRALPDALDVMVVCLQGGLSLPASLARVAHELAMAHPMLAVELNIVERHMQMGRSTGEAVREFANRFDLEELRSMASVLNQAERMGSSVAAALEVFADTLRLRRHQRAEEMAHQASIKMLFPTLVFIFPAIFIVILGPAAIQVYEQLLKGVFQGGGG